MVKKGSWVRIKKIVLKPGERSTNLPESTKMVPLLLWVKGFLLEDSSIGSLVEIKTNTGRIETGELIEVNPAFLHTYGDFVPEILEIDRIVKDTLYGVDNNE